MIPEVMMFKKLGFEKKNPILNKNKILNLDCDICRLI